MPDDDPVGSKHVAVCILDEVVFDGYLFTAYINIKASWRHKMQESSSNLSKHTVLLLHLV
jgi:hypothetical protein